IPLEDRTLYMWHGYEVTSSLIAEHSGVEIRSVWIMWILFISILGNNVVLVFTVRQVKLAFSVCNPYTQCAPRQGRQHNRVVLLYFYRCKTIFVFLRCIMQHFSMYLMLRIDKFQFHEQLATVTHTDRHRIRTCKEVFQRLFRFLVVKKSSGPTFC